MSERNSQIDIDRRRLRSERSRQAIVDATLQLFNGGVLQPTAQQIATTASVGLRTFFRHFEDMDSLWSAVDEQIGDSYRALFAGGDRQGTLEERLEKVVLHYAGAYEKASLLLQATELQLWASSVVRKNYAKGQQDIRRDLEDWIPEICLMTVENRECVDAVVSFDMWHRLRSHQKLDKSMCISIVTNMMRELVLPRPAR